MKKCFMNKRLMIVATLLATGLANSIMAAGPVTSPGWYYTTVTGSGSSAHYDDRGPFAGPTECNAARSTDFGDGGAMPVTWGPGCFELFANDIPAYNELLEHWNLATAPGGGTPAIGDDIHQVFTAVNILIEQHAIRDYRKSLNITSNIKERRDDERR